MTVAFLLRYIYGVGWSILVYLRQLGSHLKDILFDLFAFSIYTPSAVASTYKLMMIRESLVKVNIVTNGTSHLIAFSAIFGMYINESHFLLFTLKYSIVVMAAIDFSYSSWLMVTFQKHLDNWRDWYKNNSTLKVVLPKIKLRPRKDKKKLLLPATV